MAHLSGSDSVGRSVQMKIPELDSELRSLSDEALVKMFVKACRYIKQTDLSLPHDRVVEGIVDGFARCNACLRELQSRKKLHLLNGLGDTERKR